MRDAQTLRERRESLGLSQEDVARMADVSNGQMGRIERAESVPKLDTAAKIAGPLGLSLEQVLELWRYQRKKFLAAARARGRRAENDGADQ